MPQLNIKFADGNELVSYDDDTYYLAGCPTCDYGSEYVNDIIIVTTNYHINVKVNQMYEYAFAISDAIKMFAIDMKSITETKFVDYIIKEFKKFPTDYIRVNDEIK